MAQSNIEDKYVLRVTFRGAYNQNSANTSKVFTRNYVVSKSAPVQIGEHWLIIQQADGRMAPIPREVVAFTEALDYEGDD